MRSLIEMMIILIFPLFRWLRWCRLLRIDDNRRNVPLRILKQWDLSGIKGIKNIKKETEKLRAWTHATKNLKLPIRFRVSWSGSQFALYLHCFSLPSLIPTILHRRQPPLSLCVPKKWKRLGNNQNQGNTKNKGKYMYNQNENNTNNQKHQIKITCYCVSCSKLGFPQCVHNLSLFYLIHLTNNKKQPQECVVANSEATELVGNQKTETNENT